MTITELTKEWDHVYQNRLGSLCRSAEPTPEQRDIAANEADDHVEALKAGDA